MILIRLLSGLSLFVHFHFLQIISQDLWMDPHQYYLMKNDLFSDAHGVDTVNWSEDEEVEAEQATE